MNKFKKIYVEITNICNLKCPFCSIDDNIKKELSLEEFEEILKNIDNHTDYLYLHVKGEPLLHSRFGEILKLCKKYNKKINITTNGTLLENRINDIIGSNVRQINISLQSLINLDYLENIIKSADILSKNNIQIQYRMWVHNEYERKVIKILEKHYNKKIEGNNTKLDNNIYFNVDKEFIWPDLKNEIIRENGSCYGTRSHIGILVDGTIIPCCLDSKGIINLGNIFENNLEEVLKSKRYLKMKLGFQNNKIEEELCKKCGFFK